MRWRSAASFAAGSLVFAALVGAGAFAIVSLTPGTEIAAPPPKGTFLLDAGPPALLSPAPPPALPKALLPPPRQVALAPAPRSQGGLPQTGGLPPTVLPPAAPMPAALPVALPQDVLPPAADLESPPEPDAAEAATPPPAPRPVPRPAPRRETALPPQERPAPERPARERPAQDRLAYLPAARTPPAAAPLRPAEPQSQSQVLTPTEIRRIKLSLRLTPEQALHWPPVEAALSQAAAQQMALVRSGQDASGAFNSSTSMRIYWAAQPLLSTLREDQKAQIRARARTMGFGTVASYL
ncbi:hypothetical protein OPKNFCMD_0465 [Methylobacterium crusticola]|uniref:Uncharacterized protein n=1 Tax=Methylobacterium crusticola TaxID=1697972 RepID=A0ABQ4QSK5_9HYPH|nr:hypothetical protein [Methylobacterium crusticola]GJD47755.1 hypothetical protein OPKNFCMD_0465 [Methylobacterium crusticola]